MTITSRTASVASAAFGLFSLAALWASPALAHDQAYLDALTAPHGGQLRMAGPLHLELVVNQHASPSKAQAIEVYVTDHAGTPQPTQDAHATVTLRTGTRQDSTSLQPGGDNKLAGQISHAASARTQALVSVTMAGQPAQQARFTPWAPRPAPRAAGHEGHH